MKNNSLRIGKKPLLKERKNSISNLNSEFINRVGMPCAAKKRYDTKKTARIAAARI